MELISERTPLDQFCEKESKHLIRQVLKEVQPKHELIIRLRYWEGMKYAQIAKIIGTTPGAVGGTLSYIQNKLHKKLSEVF